jgi:hypothetical protein
MNIILKYNENNYNYNLDINLEIGNIFENILDFYNLTIYNIENAILFINYNKTLKEYILGDNQLLFHIIFKEFIEYNKFNCIDIIRIEIYDKKINKDYNSNENYILDKYFKWYQEKESNKYIKYLNENINLNINNIKNINDNQNEIQQEKDEIINNSNNILNNINQSNFGDLFSNNIYNESYLENNDCENIDVLRTNISNNISMLLSQPIINYIDIINNFNFIQYNDDNNDNNDNINNNLFENIITALTDDEFNKLEKLY